MDEQQENIERVTARIGRVILEFCEFRDTMYADDLRKYVAQKVGKVAPGSPDRILRALRQQGKLDYEVISRSKSYYRIFHKLQRELF